MIYKLNFVMIFISIIQTIKVQLFEDFNTLKLQSNTWKCINNGLQAYIYSCPYGMDLIQLSKQCNKIQNTITNIEPHFQIQIYIDFYIYGSIDNGEVAIIKIDNNQIYSLFRLQADYLHYQNQCTNANTYFSAITLILDVNHSDNQMVIDFITNLNENFPNEGYTFRNLQIFYNKCYKTCKTCINDLYNGCLTCFTINSIPINSECQTCQNQQNQKFLHLIQGCIQECPDGYLYNNDFICEIAYNMILISQLNIMQPMNYQDLTPSQIIIRNPIICGISQYLVYQQNEILSTNLNLPTSSVSLRIRTTFSFFGVWTSNQSIQILLNNQIISTIILNNQTPYIQNGIILYQDLIYQNCGGQNLFQIRVEINQIINNNIQNIQFQGNQIVDNSISWTVTNIIIESIQCSLNCQICLNYNQCNQCQISYYLYKGQCITQCPSYSDIYLNKCIDLDEEIIIPQNSKSQYIMKEFYDLSTTNEKINQLFTIQNSNSLNFVKETGIYFSYLPNKRVFGGPLIWLNAQFLFKINIPKYYYQIRIKFQVILGDNFDTGIFQYQINNLNIINLDLNIPNPIQNQQIWGDHYNEYVIQIDQYLNQEDFNNQQQLKILFTCQNPTKQINQAFCAIQDFFITAIFNCPIEYKFDLYKYYNNEYPCISICGDGIIIDQEQCDDGNNIPFDGCYNCQFQCNELCLFCVYGECLLNNINQNDIDIFTQLNQNYNIQQNLIINQQEEYYIINCQLECEICINNNCIKCYNGYYLNNNQYCQSQCGDNIIVDKEECDDGNNNILDNCVNCKIIKYQQCNQYCSFCYYEQCLKCNYGYSLNNNECIQICGDNIVNKDIEYLEECDNVNSDGCINCKIEQGYSCIQYDQSICWTCDIKCISCIKNQEYLECKQCIDGYYPYGQDCLLCDDNCITCKDQSDLCTSCYRDDCQKCEDINGLYTDIQLKKCIPQCGDGIKIDYYEQCDDGNNDNGDGCDFECNLEYEDSNSFIQTFRYNGHQSNDIQINVDNTKILLCQKIIITIDNFNETEFIYNNTIQNENCQINFTFYKSIYKSNLIHLKLQFQQNYQRILTNLETKEIVITPVEQIILDEGQQNQADAISNAQSTFSLLLWILAPLSILFGLFDYLWSILEILSWINNFYFLNVNYPFNVQILFLNSDWSSIVNFPTYNEFNKPNSEYYIQAPQRFQDKNVDPLFINNVQIPFFFIFTSIILYLTSTLILLFFQLINKLFTQISTYQTNQISIFCIQKQIEKQEKQEKQIKIKIQQNIYLQMIVKLLIKINQQFYNKIKQTISLCSLDITMAITLQFVYAINYQYFIITLNHILALLFSLVLLYQLKQTYYVIGIHKELAISQQFKQKYGCYYEQINIENSFGFLYNFIALIRKILYIFSTVYFYYFPLLQTTFCFLSCITGILLLLYSNPFETKGQLIKEIISEAGLSIIVLITVIFSIDDQIKKITNEFKIILGWIIISIVCLCVLTEILTLLYEIIKFLYENILNFLKIIFHKKQNNIDLENNVIDITNQIQNISQNQNQLKPSFKPINGIIHFVPKQ